MSIETNTPKVPSREHQTSDERYAAQAEQNDFAEVEAWQRSQDAAQAARRLVGEQASDQSQVLEAAKVPNNTLRNIATGAALTGAIVGGGIAVDQMQQPKFSEETTTFTADPGEGLYDAAEEVIGSEQFDQRDIVSHIESLPVNIDPLKDGLQAGESITIPVEVEK